MAKSELKFQARALRKSGNSIKKIARDLQVSTSTASLWCRDIILSPVQISQLEKNSKDPFYGRRLTYSLKQQMARKVESEGIRKESMDAVLPLSSRDKLMVGIALYWAEGFKKDKMVGFANTDPAMIIFILDWLQKSLNVPKELVRLRVGINESHSKRTSEIESFWSKVTQMPLDQFQKPYYQKVVWKKTYDHPEEYFGTLRIRVHKSTKLLKKIKGMVEGLAIPLS